MSGDPRLVPIVLGCIGNLDGKTFLDVACGLGRWGYEIKLGFSGHPKYTVGLDVWLPNLKFSKNHSIYDDVILADARFLPVKDNSFNTVCACEVLLHIQKERGYSVLKELERVSNQNVIISTPNQDMNFPEDLGNPFERNLSRWSTKELKKLGYKVKGVGFQIKGHKISGLVLSGLTSLSIFSRFGELIVGLKEVDK